MDQADVYGLNSVASLIENSGKSKFIIRRAGSKGAPLWEFSDIKGSPQRAKSEFQNWANTLLSSGRNSNVYQISLFNTEEDQDGASKTKSKEKPFLFTFALSKEQSYQGEVISQDKSNNSISNDNLVNAVRLVMKEQQESEITRKLAEIEERFEEMDQEAVNGTGNNNNDTMSMILGALAGLLNKNQPVANQGLAGLPDESERELLKNSINRLYKLDKDLAQDLNKLAEIGEKNPSQFNFLLNALRNM